MRIKTPRLLVMAAAGWMGACGTARDDDVRIAAADTAASVAPPTCTAPRALVGLDHVIVTVQDLERAKADYRAAGFTLKPGRLHANGLLNAHAKLRDSTEIELMSLAEPPGDRMAQGYASFLEGGEGGAYLALHAEPEAILAAVRASGIEANVSSGIYVGFAGVPNVFALERFPPPADPDSIFAHTNGATAMREVWIEGGETLERVLRAAGAVACGPVAPPTGVVGGTGAGYAVANGRVVVRAPHDPARPVVLGVTLAASRPGAPIPSAAARGIWIALEGVAGR